MPEMSRRDLFKTGAAVAAVSATPATEAAPARKRAARKIETPKKPEVRQRLKFDFGWKFHLGHACDMVKDFGFGLNQKTFAKAGEGVALCTVLDFDDSGWSDIDLPHDWAMDLPYTPSKNPPPPSDDPKDLGDPAAAHGYKPIGREYPENSVGWYRRVFDVPQADLGKRIAVEFDGVFRDAQVMINGYLVARNGSGYSSFEADLTDFLNYGGKNVLCVRVDATLGEGWFYEGAGIYRHVWLSKTDKLHIPQWGIFVRSEMQGKTAVLTLETEVRNASLTPRSFVLHALVCDPEGRLAAQMKSQSMSIGSLATRKIVQKVRLSAPALWSLRKPQLYRLIGKVVEAGKTTDDHAVDFGVRSFRFDPEKGFILNGEAVKLNGTCNHQDHAGVGCAVPDRLQYWRIERLQEFGCNAYRMSHNPPAPELLDACDKLGMLVIDETRRMSSDPESMDDMARMIRRDRNHPSIIAWSIGNEEPQQGTIRGARVAASMIAALRELDPTRPTCAAVDNPDAWDSGFSPLVDILGANYRTDKIPAFHKRNPKQPMIGTETGSTVAARGVYVRNPASGYCVAYDLEHPWWANTAEEWLKVVAPADYIAGGFVWTGFDYHGEPTPFNRWPNVASQFGVMDMCGFPKDNYYYYKAWWTDEPSLHLFPHWNWRPGETVSVWCHSNLDAVELFVNGQSRGLKPVPRLGHVEWTVAFAPGRIEARGYRQGKLVLTDVRVTAGPASKVKLTLDRSMVDADGEDVLVATATIVDADGVPVPDANHRVTFDLAGPAAIIGVGNGDPCGLEPEKGAVRSAFNGLCMAIVRTKKQPGEIVLRVTSPGLAGDTARIDAKPVVPCPCV